ncbi:dicarboxylate/amino acid:cation symporter [Enterococcus sp. LJL99]
MEIIKNNKGSIYLLLGVLIGGLIGIFFSDVTIYLKPIGDIFLNAMFVLIVPLVFLSLTNAIIGTKEIQRLGKILITTLLVFFMTAVVIAFVSYFVVSIYNPFEGMDTSGMKQLMGEVTQPEKRSFGEVIVQTFTVDDFLKLFDKANLLPLIIFSLFFGVAITLVGKPAEPLANLLKSANEVIMKLVELLMKVAPLGLGSYFAYTIGSLGTQILGGYINSLLLYLVITVIYFFGVFSFYAFIAGGKKGVQVFWKNIMAPALTAMGTSSSAASIPVNLIATKKMGVPDDIAETVIPLGANTHKDGSVVGGMLKIIFLFTMFNKDYHSFSQMWIVIGVSILVGIVIGSIPSGGLTAELLIVSLFGFPMEMIPVIAVISTLIDIPATLLNSTGNTVCAMLVSRIVEGKNWLQAKVSE